MRTLVFNAGSTTLKLAVLEGEREVFAKTLEHPSPAAAVSAGIEEVRSAGLLPVEAVGHRIVHGGPDFTQGVLLTDEVVARITALNDLAPLHNPPALAAIAAARGMLPEIPQIAAFDTAYHATIPAQAATYAVPASWTRDWGIRKYGFHGLSHAYCVRRAREMLPESSRARIVVAHLGGGCSLSANVAGRCIETTMGFTPLDGLMMASRCGWIDPGVLIHVMRHHGLTPDQLEHALNQESGLLGVSGLSQDFREVERASAAGNPSATLAFEMFAYRIQVGIGAMAAAMGGITALVFSAGIGEHSARLRLQVCEKLEFLGVEVDPAMNQNGKPDMEIGRPRAAARILLIHTLEDVVIVREIERILANPAT